MVTVRKKFLEGVFCICLFLNSKPVFRKKLRLIKLKKILLSKYIFIFLSHDWFKCHANIKCVVSKGVILHRGGAIRMRVCATKSSSSKKARASSCIHI